MNVTIKDLEAQYQQDLKNICDEEEAKALFSLAAGKILELAATKIRMIRETPLTLAHLQKLQVILQELKTGKPIQHILGEAHFYGLIFKVNDQVLIPRPETEELVDWIIKECRNKLIPSQHMLDIGTGSGCIPITLKKYFPRSAVSSIDISSTALSVAKENASKLQSPVQFIQADVLTYQPEHKYDVIVSNPPYIRQLEQSGMHENVLKHEPHLALFVSDKDPLIFYSAIADLALQALNENGRLFFEINEHLGIEMVKMLEEKGFTDIELRKDMEGKDRMIRAKISIYS